MSNHQSIEVRKESETKHHSSTDGILFWKKTNHWEETIYTNIAEVSDVEHNIRNYRNNSVKMINDRFKELLKIEELKNHIKSTVMSAFEKADKDFNEDRILIPLDNALNKITLPQIDIQMESYEAMLDSMLSDIVSKGAVKNDDIPELKVAQDKILNKLADDIEKQIKKQGEEIELNLKEQAADFIDSIVNELKNNQEKLETLLKDKQESIKRLECFVNDIITAKSMLNQIGE